jgi:hypothetical protein
MASFDIRDFYREEGEKREEKIAQEFYGITQDGESTKRLIEEMNITNAQQAQMNRQAVEYEMSHLGFRKIQSEHLKWITAGHAIFTVRNTKTGNRFTYSVIRPRTPARSGEDILWVAVLRGPDNTGNYTSLGRIVLNPNGTMEYKRNMRSPISENAPSAIAFAWLFKVLIAGSLPECVEIWHAGRCCRCGRLLTVPESVEAGIGPECASKF